VTRPVLSLEGVTKRFGATVAVRSLSLSVHEGECLGLIGPNGAGKTTTFSMLCGYLSPTEGQVRVLDVDPRTPGGLKRRLGALPQDAQLPGWAPVGLLLTHWAKLSRLSRPEEEARAALTRVGLAETWNERAENLSHGMAKRVALAQALMGSPPVLLLDEPTAGLDPKSAAHVRDLIRERAPTQTLVVSSHNLHELEQLCDSAAILDRGAPVYTGSMAQLTAADAEFQIEIARGNVPLQELRALQGVLSAALTPDGGLTVGYDGSTLTAEEIITRTVALLIERGVLFRGVKRGRKLEERVLQLT
jgi:ABC-type multidrug transport system ATPase subunit